MIADDRGMSIAMEIGAMASGIPMLRSLRYCPQCLHSDKVLYGETYWHRSHQIAGVNVCHEHGVRLLELETQEMIMFNKHLYRLPPDFPPEEWIVCPSGDTRLLLARQTHWILNHRLPSLGLNEIRERYLCLLGRRGFLTAARRVKQRDFLESFLRFYDRSFLAEVSCMVDAKDQDTWLHKLVRLPRNAQHPIRHVLLMHFLGVTVEQFFGCLPDDGQPFGQGPWPCLNAGAPHYKEAVVTDCKITRDSKFGVPVGTFTCDCGFMYSRRGPDRVPEDRYKIGRIKAFGPVWQSALRERCQDPTQSLRSIARSLNVDVGTVKKYRGFDDQDNVRLNRIDNLPARESNPEQYRRDWSDHMKNHPDLSRTQLRKLAPATYMRLYRHDREWLNQFRMAAPRGNQLHRCVDWEARDRDITHRILTAASSLQSRTNPPVRLTLSSIGKFSGTISLLQKHLDRLPETVALLETLVETVDQFQLRRVQLAASDLFRNGEEVVAWKIMRKAGLRATVGEHIKNAVANRVTAYARISGAMMHGADSNQELALSQGRTLGATLDTFSKTDWRG